MTKRGGQRISSHWLHRTQSGVQPCDRAAQSLLPLRTLAALETNRLDCPKLNLARTALDREAAVGIDVQVRHHSR